MRENVAINKKELFLIISFVLIIISLRLWNAQNYPFEGDEVISINAAQGIVKHGIPIVYQGKIYSRSLLGHYLLAIPVYLWGTNEVTTRSVNIILSGLLLIIIYLMGKDLYNEYVGILAVLFLAFLRFENQYAISARFYMPFQFFYILTLFLFYKGFLEDKQRYRPLCIASLLCCIFSHRLSMELIPVLILFPVIIKKWGYFKDRYFLLGSILIGAALYFTIFYHSPSQVQNLTSPRLVTGSMEYKLSFFNILDRTVLHGLSVVILGLIYLYKEKSRKLFFCYFAFFVSIGFLSVIAPDNEQRYVFNLLPLYILLLSYALIRISKSAYRLYVESIAPRARTIGKYSETSVVLILIVATLFLLTRVFEKKVGFKSSYPDLKSAHLFIRDNMQSDDIIISTNPEVTRFYLGRTDYFLRQKKTGHGYGEFGIEKSHYGVSITDSVDKLTALLNRDNRIWIFADRKIYYYTGDELILFVKQNFSEVYYSRKNKTRVYFRDHSPKALFSKYKPDTSHKRAIIVQK
jgi:4-amino-4-deoxy-L-arabinose transferase-like glycosyltransferase